MLLEDGTSGEERRSKEQQHIFGEIVKVFHDEMLVMLVRLMLVMVMVEVGEERRGKEKQHIFGEIVKVLTSICDDGSGYGKEVTIVMVMDYGWEKEWGKEEINIFGGRDDFVQYCDHLRTTGPPSPLLDWSSACQGTSFD